MMTNAMMMVMITRVNIYFDTLYFKQYVMLEFNLIFKIVLSVRVIILAPFY